MLRDYSINDWAVGVIERELRPNQEALQIRFHTYACGATVIDMGVYERGGFLAAKALTEISLCGFGQLRLTKKKIGGVYMPCAAVYVDHPVVAELASHSAILRVKHCGVEKNFSGPVRGKVHDAYAAPSGYRDEKTQHAVIAYQIDYLPAESLVLLLAERAQVKPEDLYLMVARTGTLTGSVQISARNVEQTLPALVDAGFPVGDIVYAMGVAPVLPAVDDELEAYGRVNDALIYGQSTWLCVDCEDGDILPLLDRLTMDQPRNAEVYGVPFREIFARCGNDWCQLPRHWDSPSQIDFYNLRTGNRFTTGKHRPDVLLGGYRGGRDGKGHV